MIKKLFLVSILLLISSGIIAQTNDSAFAPKTEEKKEKKPFTFFQETWNEVRKAIEEGRKPGEKVVVSTQPVKVETPPPAEGVAVELPYETALSITGRKFIGIDFKYTDYDNPPQNVNDSGTFDMKQELQVRIKGRVGRKINVNVDFDDTVPDKRDISVSYKGDPDEFIQEAAFGDITLSLPNTEFIGYSRQAFGVKLVTKYKSLKTWIIGSQAKGTPDTKRFTGKTTLARTTIQDINYLKKKYYDLNFGTITVITPNSIEVYRDDRNAMNDQNTLNLTYSSYTSPQVAISTGAFDKLQVGIDYIVDYPKSMIKFLTMIGENHLVVINYKIQNSTTNLNDSLGTTNYILLKDDQNMLPYEIKTYYSLGKTQIVPDNGRGNFILYITKDSGERPTADEWTTATGTTTIPAYPANLRVDFPNGIFNIENPDGSPWQVFPRQVYIGQGATAKYQFYIECRSEEKEYWLNPGVIPQSEQVMLDGKILKKDADYFIDYDIGKVTFLREGMVSETSTVDISYEYAIFGAQVGETFSGMRNELSLTKNVFVGASYMKNYPARSQGVQDLNSIAYDLSVWEVDTKISDLKLAGPLRITQMGGEYAESSRNMNIFEKAMVDSMENIEQLDGPSINKDLWKYGWSPLQYYPDAIKWDNVDMYVRDIYNIPYEQIKEEKQRVLQVQYDLTRTSGVAIVQNMSNIGIDFSKKDYFELKMKGTQQSSGKMIIELGQFSEDADHDGTLDTEDLNSNHYLDDISGNEDTGWLFNASDFPNDNKRVGVIVNGRVENNGNLDTEDLNGDNLLNMNNNSIGHFEINLSELDPVNWTYKKIPITKVNQFDWLYIKQIKITVDSQGNKGEFYLTDVGATSNKWENLTSGLTIYAINNYDDKYYRDNSFMNQMPSEYEGLYGKQLTTTLKKEQSLALEYDFSGSSASQKLATRLSFKQKDFTASREIHFFVYGDGNNETLIFKAGNDDNNYFEFKTPVNWTANTWKHIIINQIDSNKDSIPEQWSTDISSAECIGIGNPSLSNITYLDISVSSSGIISNTTYMYTNNNPNRLWVDEIYMSNPYMRKGTAYLGYVDMGVDKWGGIGYKAKHVDSNFETFSQPIKNQESTDRSAYLNFTRMSFLPMSCTYGTSETNTPDVQKSGELVSTLEGAKVTRKDYSYNSNFSYNRLPRLGYNYTNSSTTITNARENIFRDEIKDNNRLDFSYDVPRLSKIDTVDSFLPTNLSVNFTKGTAKYEPWEAYRSTSNPVSKDISESGSLASMPFNMFKNGLTLSPSYSHSRTYTYEEREEPLTYDKSKSQRAGLNSTVKVREWFQPSMNYSVNTDETYIFNINTDTQTISKSKNVNRSSSGNISAGFGMNKILPKFKYVNSLNFSQLSYGISNVDSYSSLPGEFSTLDKLWVGQTLSSGTLLSFSRSNTISASTRWDIFEGINFSKKYEPLKNMHTSTSFSETVSDNNTTGTLSKNYRKLWPDLEVTLNDTEKMFGVGNYISDSRFNVRTTETTNITYNIGPLNEQKDLNNNYNLSFNLLKNYSLTVSHSNTLKTGYDNTTGKRTNLDRTLNYAFQPSLLLSQKANIRLTPSITHNENENWSGDPSYTKDLLTDTLGVSYTVRTSFPSGMRIPLIGKTMPLKNDFTFNSNFTYTRKDTVRGDIANNKTDDYSIKGDATYEISANLRMTGGLGIQRFMNRHDNTRNYTAYSINTQLSIIF